MIPESLIKTLKNKETLTKNEYDILLEELSKLMKIADAAKDMSIDHQVSWIPLCHCMLCTAIRNFEGV